MQQSPDSAPISVVIPAFNSAHTLAACLRSVLAQTTLPREIIVVDDGSQDNTAAVARAFGRQVRLLQQPNQGCAAARQYGTKEASCDHIAYLDADDWWPDHTVENYARILAREHVDFLLADFVRSEPGADSKSYLPRNSSFFPKFLSFARAEGDGTAIDALIRLSSGKALEGILGGFPSFFSASLARRESVLAVGGWNVRIGRCQDLDMALRLTKQFPMHYYYFVQAIVGLNEGNRDGTRYVIQQTRACIGVLQSHYTAAQSDVAYRRQLAEALSRKCYSLGETYRNAGDKRAALRAYQDVFRWPGRRAKAVARMMSLPINKAGTVFNIKKIATLLKQIRFRWRRSGLRDTAIILHGASSVGKSHILKGIRKTFADVRCIEMDVYIHKKATEHDLDTLEKALTQTGLSRGLFCKLLETIQRKPLKATVELVLACLNDDPLMITCADLPAPNTNKEFYELLSQCTRKKVIHVLISPSPDLHLERLKARGRAHESEKWLRGNVWRAANKHHYDLILAGDETVAQIHQLIVSESYSLQQ